MVVGGVEGWIEVEELDALFMVDNAVTYTVVGGIDRIQEWGGGIRCSTHTIRCQ